MSDKNNNKRPNDGRKYNKRVGRTKVIKASENLPAARTNKAKRDRAKRLSAKAIRNVFKEEDAIWDMIAEEAKNGSFNHLDMLMKYAYGKPGENRDRARAATKAPVIQFINNEAKEKSKTIDIIHEEVDERDQDS